MTLDYTCCPGDHIPCPKCDALGGPRGMIRARGVMHDKEYNDRRCNACGHLWIVGETLDLPLGDPESTPGAATGSHDRPVTPAKEESSGKPPLYDFGDGFERENPTIPF